MNKLLWFTHTQSFSHPSCMIHSMWGPKIWLFFEIGLLIKHFIQVRNGEWQTVSSYILNNQRTSEKNNSGNLKATKREICFDINFLSFQGYFSILQPNPVRLRNKILKREQFSGGGVQAFVGHLEEMSHSGKLEGPVEEKKSQRNHEILSKIRTWFKFHVVWKKGISGKNHLHLTCENVKICPLNMGF